MINPCIALFVDIDGVLNFTGTKTRNPGGCYGIEPKLVRRLREIVRKTRAQVVVSSTWRKYPDLMAYAWRKLGPFVKRHYVGDTPSLQSSLWTLPVRGDEIQAWLTAHPEVKRFAILDDCNDMAHLKQYLFRTTIEYGLTKSITGKVIGYLTGEPNDS